MRWFPALVALGCDVSSADRRAPTVRLELDSVAPDSLCVTKGELAGARVDVPTFRAVAAAHNGDAASMRFVVHGETAETRALASGQERRQLGLKLRARDGCNLVYVMWRLDPKPKLDVSVKRNRGAHASRDCGARGYTKVKPARTERLPALDVGVEHELRAQIDGDVLVAWIDDRAVWRGTLPAAALELTGPAGVRSDNLAFELTAFAVDSRRSSHEIRCKRDDSD